MYTYTQTFTVYKTVSFVVIEIFIVDSLQLLKVKFEIVIVYVMNIKLFIKTSTKLRS